MKCIYCDNKADRTLIWLKDKQGRSARVSVLWCGCTVAGVEGIDYEVQTEPGQMGTAPIYDDMKDQGGLAASLKVEPHSIKIDFGTTITFLRMTADEAEAFAIALYGAARELRSR